MERRCFQSKAFSSVTLATPIRLARLPGVVFCALFPAPGPGALDLRFFPRIRFASSSFFFFWRSGVYLMHLSDVLDDDDEVFVEVIPALIIWSNETASWLPAMTEIGEFRRRGLGQRKATIKDGTSTEKIKRAGGVGTGGGFEERVWSARRERVRVKERFGVSLEVPSDFRHSFIRYLCSAAPTLRNTKVDPRIALAMSDVRSCACCNASLACCSSGLDAL